MQLETSPLDEAQELLKSVRAGVHKFNIDSPDLGLLDELAADLSRLRELLAKNLLARYDATTEKFAETIAALEIGRQLEAGRALLARQVLRAEAESWLDGIAVLLDLIQRLYGENQELMRNISAAATDNDLDAIQRYTEAAQTKKTNLKEKVSALKIHLAA
jgi:hypothetical protein